MFGIRDYLKACEYRQGFLENQSQWLYQERQQFQLDVENLVSDLDRVRSEMAGYLVPEINDEHLKELEGVLGGYGLMDIKAIYESKFDAAERRRVQLEGMEEVRDFEQQNAQASRLIKGSSPNATSFAQNSCTGAARSGISNWIVAGILTPTIGRLFLISFGIGEPFRF